MRILYFEEFLFQILNVFENNIISVEAAKSGGRV
jgi:hypothetical protein